MGLFTPDVHTLRELYVSKLEHALSSERQIVEKGLPAMIDKATNPELKEALYAHLEESRMHVSRLERVLDAREGEDNDSRCKATAALISQAETDIGDTANEAIRDVVVIAAGNAVEHHEIAVYGTLRTWAGILGENEDVVVLERTLKEEIQADKTLTALAQTLNVAAPVC